MDLMNNRVLIVLSSPIQRDSKFNVARLIKNIIIFIVLFFLSYFLSVIAVLLFTFIFFRDANPNLETVMFVFVFLIPVLSISGAVAGLRLYIKKRQKKKTPDSKIQII